MKKKIDRMHLEYGERDRKCKECSNFRRIQAGNRVVFKCGIYGLSSSSATDWRANWKACGMFNRDKSECIMWTQRKWGDLN